ncbi:VWA domain-containing protein [Vibrio genomosp. F10]|uniref:VWFA domain-containing protein n=1 Tax=Vibrio genomosp. F10 TaxID=723171 RepID=A0A1B9R3D8_9VIBR|nr:VWA domain-containing protein [Vibrio genomosp. F10]OCH78692.1 hypothetical protein A6E14_03905 [Vibrio genomosp. F10]
MSNFTFLYPFWLLALIPAAILVGWLYKYSTTGSLIAPHLAKAIGLDAKPRKRNLIYLIALGLLSAIIALAGPSFYSAERPVFGNGGGRVVVMDMSLSMYASDIKPNRLTQSRYKVTDLLNSWSEGTTGLVAYAGDAYTVSPMTTDNQTLLNLLPNLSPDIMPFSGANAAAGVQLAIEMMQNSGLNQGDIILVVDDIDDDEKNAITQLLSHTPWRLSILAVATPAGSPIRLSDGSLVKTGNGNTAIAQSNFTNMKALARNVDGVFTGIQADSSDIDIISAYSARVEASASLGKQQLEERVNSGYWLILLLVIPVSLLFRRGVVFTLVAIIFSLTQPNLAYANPWLTDDQEAFKLYQNQHYQQAADAFSNKEWRGVAKYRAGDFEGAIKEFEQLESDNARYNLANAHAQHGDYQKAIDGYNQLIQDGKLVDQAKENLRIVEQAQQQQQKNSGEEGENQPDSSDDNTPSDEQQSSSDSSQSEQDPSSGNDQKNEPQSNPQGKQQDKQKGESANNQDDQADTDEQANSDKQDKTADSDAQSNDEASNKSSDEASNEASDHQDTLNHDLKSEAQDSKPTDNGTATARQDNQQAVDPNIRKLEQVESARDPSRLLQAQMVLQAKQKQPPKDSGKKW